MSAAADPSLTRPTAPIELTGSASRFGEPPTLPDGFAGEAVAICPTISAEPDVAEASRDWWPLAMHWALQGQVARRAALVARPRTTNEVAALVALCARHRVPVTAAGGRSSVSGGVVPVSGGVIVDMTDLHGLVGVDEESQVVEVMAGTFGPDLERALERVGLSVGHFPQSFDISTVGGWVACRGAGQHSTRYGKIEDMVVGLEVVLADGTVVQTGGTPRAAVGPDLNSVFVGSEGMLGVITRVWFRAHHRPEVDRRAAYGFADFADGVTACRRILQRGATPAVLRLYDAAETARGHGGDGTHCALLVLDEGDPIIVDATMAIIEQECAAAPALPVGLVDAWMEHRNDTSALQALTRKGFVVDTMEVGAPWSALGALYRETCAALLAVPHTRAATCHLSHSYPDGACLYFTFAATPPADEVESTYVALWDAGQRSALAAGANLSHHHGVGLNRSRFVAQALGDAIRVLGALKSALDPAGILNPGKFGLTETDAARAGPESPWP